MACMLRPPDRGVQEFYIVPRTGVFTTYTRLNTGLRLQRGPELDEDLERQLYQNRAIIHSKGDAQTAHGDYAWFRLFAKNSAIIHSKGDAQTAHGDYA